MGKPKSNVSVFFRHEDEDYFLVQVLNVGRDTDELKFVFNDSGSDTASIYTDARGVLGPGALIRLRPEVSYHSDGSVLHKLVRDRSDPRTIYKNPHGEGERRTPLAEIGFWEPLIRQRVVNYRTCRKKSRGNAVCLPDNPAIFNGDPFEARIYIGGKMSPVLVDDERSTSIMLENVADTVDVAVMVFKSEYRGQHIRHPELGQDIWSDLTVVEVIERAE